MTDATFGRSRVLLLAVVPALVAGALFAAERPDLTADRSFRITSPADGRVIGQLVTLSWTATAGANSYAVVVDQALPAPKTAVRPGDRVITLTGRTLRLELGSATSGSPSARDVHQIAVVPLDAKGKRIGEDVAWLRVRTNT